MGVKADYSGLQIGLHWVTAVLIAANYFVSDGMPEALDARMAGQAVVGLTPVFHVWVGSALLAIVLLRLLVRLVSGAPVDAAQGWKERAAGLAHWLLYGLMIAVPALGVAAWFFGVAQAADLHVLVMNAMMLLILGHATMAIFHHYVLRDGLLRKMRPQR